jgi:hypothetical protein
LLTIRQERLIEEDPRRLSKVNDDSTLVKKELEVLIQELARCSRCKTTTSNHSTPYNAIDLYIANLDTLDAALQYKFKSNPTDDNHLCSSCKTRVTYMIPIWFNASCWIPSNFIHS